MKKVSLIVVLFISLFALRGFTQSIPSHLRISVLTCGPGEELYTVFGHTAIRIIDSTKQTDIVFNFGNFDFNDPDFYSKFIKGGLDYFLAISSFPEFMEEYRVDKRDVTEQELRLTDSTKLVIQKGLIEILNSPARSYKYDFLYNNCTSRVRDILINYAGLPTNKSIVPPKTTFRNLLYVYLNQGDHAWVKLGIDLLLASPVDRQVNKTEAMFLPDYLMRGIDSSVYNSKSGILSAKTILNKGVAGTNTNSDMPLYVFSLFAVIVAGISFLTNKIARSITRAIDFILFLVTGLVGCLLLFLWFGSDRGQFMYNYNLLLLLPTNAIAAFFLWADPRWLKKYFTACSIIYALTLLLWLWLPQQLNMALVPVAMLLLFRCLQLRKR